MCPWVANETLARALLETGTQINLLSEDVAAIIEEEIRPLGYDDGKVIHLMDGTEMEARGKSVATWSRNSKP